MDTTQQLTHITAQQVMDLSSRALSSLHVLVNITNDHIKQGSRSHPHRCPIALALAELLPIGIWPAVTTNHVFLKGHLYHPSTRIATAELSSQARWLTYQFDAGKQVEPVELFLHFIPYDPSREETEQ